jgi:hypothetical protein
MKYNNHRHDQVCNARLGNFSETASSKLALWIDDDSGQIVDTLSIESLGRSIFDIPNPELQPLPPRYAIPRVPESERRYRPIELVAHSREQPYLLAARFPSDTQPPLPARGPRLLLGKRGGSP